MKRTLKIALLLVTGSLLRITVGVCIFLFTLFSLYSDRSYIYSVLNETNTYERVPQVILNSSANQQLGQEEETQLGSEQFAPIILEAVPPEVAKLAAQQVIDAHYEWLEGTEENITFTIDLDSSKQAIIDGIASYVVNRYESLEECEEVVSGYDFFSVPCSIVGLDVDTQEEALREQLQDTPLLLRDTAYDESSLLTDARGRSVDEFAPWIKTLANNQTIILFLLTFLILILAAVSLLGASSAAKGIRRVGKIVFQGSSGFLITAALLFILLPLFGFGGLTTDSSGLLMPWQDQTYDALFNDIIGLIARDFVLRGLLFSLPFVLIGGAGWLYGSYKLEKHHHTGASFMTRLTRATLEDSGLVSSEKNSAKRRTKASSHALPIISSETASDSAKGPVKSKRKKRRSKKTKS